MECNSRLRPRSSFAHITVSFNNPSAIAARHAITHHALWEYLDALGSTDLFPDDKFADQERERSWREVYER
jgi:pumilio homology domain family member 6